MELLKLIPPIMILLFTVSCATTLSSQAQSEYYQGYNMASEYAKKDAIDHNCFIGSFRWDRSDAISQAHQYNGLLKEQGQSEIFIKGFYSGYEQNYMEFMDIYCDEYRR